MPLGRKPSVFTSLLGFRDLLRPKHWVKNLLVFVPLLFSFSLNLDTLSLAAMAFVSFSLFASAVYIVNDLADVSRDKLHPEKKYRPLASGRIKTWQALVLLVILFIFGSSVASLLPVYFIAAVLFYFALNLSYSLGLKNIAIIDVMIVSLGFVLRVVAGAYAIGVSVSHWLLLCTFFASLFIAFGKRRTEMCELDQDNKKRHRRSISEYTPEFIDQMLALTAGITVVFYSLYTIDADTVRRFQSDQLVYTIPIIVFMILRYFHLLYNRKHSCDAVQILFSDPQLFYAILFWLAGVVIVYLRIF